MTTLIGREVPRKQLKTLLKAAIDTALGVDALVEDHEPKETGGRSPMVFIHGYGSRLTFTPYVAEHHRFWVTAYWRRDDAAQTEDRFDALIRVIFQTLLDNVNQAGYWNDLEFAEDFSDQAYIVLDNVQSRTERIGVTTITICG